MDDRVDTTTHWAGLGGGVLYIFPSLFVAGACLSKSYG